MDHADIQKVDHSGVHEWNEHLSKMIAVDIHDFIEYLL